MSIERRTFLALAASAALAVGGGAFAQERREAARVAVFSWFSAATLENYEPFRRMLAELGYVEGRNLHLEFHFAEGRSDRGHNIAADLSRRGFDVIFAFATPAAHAARVAAPTTPIVISV